MKASGDDTSVPRLRRRGDTVAGNPTCYPHLATPAITERTLPTPPLLPQGEALRRALRWLSDERRHDAQAIEEAARRFDLTPLEEEFLLRHARSERPAGHMDEHPLGVDPDDLPPRRE